jgi:hypothetical protein
LSRTRCGRPEAREGRRMKIPVQTLEKMEAGAARPQARQQRHAKPEAPIKRPWQFSILAILAVTTISSVALVAVKPYWPVLVEALTPKTPGDEPASVPAIVEPWDEPEIILPLNIQPDEDDGCPGCGLG